MPAPPPLVPLHAMEPGQFADCFALLAERTRNLTREGKSYYACKFRDRKRTAAAMIWHDSPWFSACETMWKVGGFYKLRCVFGEHERYGPQVEIHNIRPATDDDRNDGFDPAELIESSRFPVEEMFEQLTALAKKEIADPPLRKLVLSLLEENRVRLQTLPATRKFFYPVLGGWLEHTLSVTRTSLMLVDHYRQLYSDLEPRLNRDLVAAGAVLHDIGRLRKYAEPGFPPETTIPGELFGHQLLGRDLIEEAARAQGDVNPGLVQLLQHLVLTHLGLADGTGLRQMRVPECLILAYAADLDAKMELHLQCLDRDLGDGDFTAVDPVLKKPLLKRRSV